MISFVTRAGGGHSQGNGSGSGGGGGLHSGGIHIGGGYYGGGSVGAVGFVIILGVAVLFIFSRYRSGRGSSPAAVDPGYGRQQMWADPPLAPQIHEGGLESIVAHDPGFDQDAFLARVQRAFFLVEQAWTERKPELSRQVMADAIWQLHRSQVEGYIAERKTNVLEDLSIGDVTILEAGSDASYDTITVRVAAACADYDVDDESGRVIRGDKEVSRWQEDWTFQRSSKATTHDSGGTLGGHCPNCGAPLDTDLAGVCRYCKAPVMSGAYDWVLTRIAQVNGGY